VRFKIHRKGAALGDTLLAALATNNLISAGVDAALDDDRAIITEHVRVPIFSGSVEAEGWAFTYTPEAQWDGRCMLRKSLDNFAAAYFPGVRFPIFHRTLEMIFRDDPSIPAVDVVFNTKTGYWSPFRNWPHFGMLKTLLTAKKISWIDLDTLIADDNRCLNYAKKARLYIGLDCGMSHFLASVVRQGLIVQSGYSEMSYWSTYAYHGIFRDTECRRCYLTYRDKCSFEHECMNMISAESVCAMVDWLLLDESGDAPLFSDPRTKLHNPARLKSDFDGKA